MAQAVTEKEKAAPHDEVAPESAMAPAPAVEEQAVTIESAADVVARAEAMMKQAQAQTVTENEAVQAASLARPSEQLLPIDVVRAQLHALQGGALRRCFDFNSPLARRHCSNAELFEEMLHDTPAYAPLVRSSSFEIRSALSTTPRNYQCRVRVDGKDYVWRLSLQPEEVLDIGTVVRHTQAGYVGVVVGWDDECRRPEEWCRLTGVDALPLGRAQPFYHVTVACGEGADGAPAALEDSESTYVAEELIQPRPAALAPVDLQVPLKMPSLLFTGAVDEESGTWEPTSFLRALHPRRIERCWLVDSVTPDEPPDGEVAF